MIYAFRRMIKSKEELGLVEALVIGFKEDLDKELVQSYSATGTVHVIAISGLHLGLIFWVINALLEMLPHHKLMKYPKLLLTLTALWGFALLAGGGPSVLRSALMFTCILIGKTMHRHSSSLNSICVAGFMLLLYNPYWLWDTGFQLSFAAVVSIICYQQSIYAFFEIRNKWMDKIWSATSVTLAAQILTLPFCIYYFHQFPVYFLLTNLVAVPLSSLVLLGALLLLALAPFHSIANRFGFAIEWLAGLMNKFIRLMESMPYGSWKYLQIDFMQATFMMLGILSTSLYLGKINKSWLWSAFGCSILVLFSRTISFNQAANQNLLIIYQLKKNSLIELVEGRYSSKIKINNTSLKILSINDPSLNASIQMRYEGTNDKYDDSHSVLSIGVGKRKLIVLQSDLRKLKPKSNHSSDWLLVTGNTKGNADSLISYFKPGEVILDGSNSISNVAKWKKACQHQVIPFYSTEEQGAFVMQLE
jgi:competence protein ComEC